MTLPKNDELESKISPAALSNSMKSGELTNDTQLESNIERILLSNSFFWHAREMQQKAPPFAGRKNLAEG